MGYRRRGIKTYSLTVIVMTCDSAVSVNGCSGDVETQRRINSTEHNTVHAASGSRSWSSWSSWSVPRGQRRRSTDCRTCGSRRQAAAGLVRQAETGISVRNAASNCLSVLADRLSLAPPRPHCTRAYTSPHRRAGGSDRKPDV